MTDKFPLFKLPYVALHEVLNHVGPEAALPLSLCSERSKLLLKHCQGPRKDIKIVLKAWENVLKVNDNSSISVAVVSKLPMNLETVNIGSHVVPVQMEGNVLKSYWMNGKEGLKEIVKLTSDVFSRDLYSISCVIDDARYWLEWIKSIQGKLPRLVLSTTKANDGLLMYILKSDIVTGDLILHSRCSPRFRGPSPRPFSMDYLYLSQSNWVTLNHLLAMDIKRIILHNSPLTCQEINTFLKKWINGECSKRIKVVYVGKKEVNYDELMEGIEVIRRDPNLKREYASNLGVGQIFGGLDFKRTEDGAMATVISTFGGFKIMFWPDYKGNPYH